MWKPNKQRKKLYSETMDEMIPLNVTASALRSIDKAGGLDEYVLNTPDRWLVSDKAVELREQILLLRQAKEMAAVAAGGESPPGSQQ